MTLDRADTLLAATAAISVAAVGGALVSQHVYDIMPCPWCVLQRLIFVLIDGRSNAGKHQPDHQQQRGIAQGLLLSQQPAQT